MPVKLSALYKNTCSNISSIQLSSLYSFKAENCSCCLGQTVKGLAGSVRSPVLIKKYHKILNYFDVFAALNWHHGFTLWCCGVWILKQRKKTALILLREICRAVFLYRSISSWKPKSKNHMKNKLQCFRVKRVLWTCGHSILIPECSEPAYNRGWSCTLLLKQLVLLSCRQKLVYNKW